MRAPHVYVALLIALILVAGCHREREAHGRIRIEAFDTPPPYNVEHIYLTITEVSVHSPESGWRTLVDTAITYDFMQLINGVTAVLCDTMLEPGHYTQMRLTVADTNEIVISGISYPLVVPSGVQTGVKLNLDFTVEPDELIEILVDFDLSTSITWTPGNYLLRPAFRAFKKLLSGTVSGTVRDTAGMGIPNALVEAITANTTTSTLTDSVGAYKLILLEGTYDIRASAEDYTTADTTYTEVEVHAGDNLTGYDFVLQP